MRYKIYEKAKPGMAKHWYAIEATSYFEAMRLAVHLYPGIKIEKRARYETCDNDSIGGFDL